MAYLLKSFFTRIRCLLGFLPTVSVRDVQPPPYAHSANNIEAIIHEQKTNNLLMEAERVEIICSWVTRRIIRFQKEELEDVIKVIRDYFNTQRLPASPLSFSSNPHYTKQYLTTTIYSACHAYSKSISRMDSINLAIALFSDLLEIPYPIDTTDKDVLASVNNLYKKVDKPIEIVELANFDQKHKESF